ncbi:MAG: translation initiation factor [Candidatus Omnitrophica bacterium]|nr:translation initiation factor [Candidatus Omnitrophota bacterium]
MKTRTLQGDGWSFEPAAHKASSAASSSIPTGSLTPDKQNIVMAIEHRSSGKMVTIIAGLVLSIAAREDLAKKLKTVCGTGGTIRDGKIELQGDQRDSVRLWLIKNAWHLKH